MALLLTVEAFIVLVEIRVEEILTVDKLDISPVSVSTNPPSKIGDDTIAVPRTSNAVMSLDAERFTQLIFEAFN
jgi:hypothetical protein